jgi:hypothetical protein
MVQIFEIDKNGCYILILHPQISLRGDFQVSSIISSRDPMPMTKKQAKQKQKQKNKIKG